MMYTVELFACVGHFVYTWEKQGTIQGRMPDQYSGS